MRRHELSETQWNRIKDLLPPERKPQGRPPGKGQSWDAQCQGVLAQHGYPLEKSARTIWALAKCIQSILCMDKSRRMGKRPGQSDPAGYSR